MQSIKVYRIEPAFDGDWRNFYDKKTQESVNYCLKSVLIEENIAADIDQHAACRQKFDAGADNE